MENKTKAIDLFLYLGIFISLVTSVTNILEIIFTAIEQKFVDILAVSYVADIYNDSMRMAIASLAVMFPIYLALSWYVSKDITKFLFKRDILVRKIMIYVSLFVTVLTLIGTLVSLIYTYLGGELSVRFELKALAVFVVALSIFGYYFYCLRRNYAVKTFVPMVIAIIAGLVVIISLVWSISIIGTPAEMRMKRIDSTRLSDISRIQQEVFNRFQATDKLPMTLEELNNAFQGYTVPTDPISKTAYTYKVVQQATMKVSYVTTKKEMVTPAIFELCSTFDTVRKYDDRGKNVGSPVTMDSNYSASNYYYDGDQSTFWNHEAEETCFKRVISPDMYYGK